MPMNYYDPQESPQGYSNYTSPGAPIEGGDTNPAGAAQDPFDYTNGSLLTPWTGRFNSSGYGGGYSAPAFSPHNYADFKYDYGPGVGQFEEKYADPAAFRFAAFEGPSDFRAPTKEDMQADPGYQVRMDAVKNAQTAGAAHGGVLRSGGFQKGLAKAVGDQASQEYGNVYGRRASEHDRLRKEGESNYGINQGNTFQSFNTNTANRLQGYQTRQNAWQSNADTAMKEGELKYNIATGTWDRNYGKSRTGWEDQQRQNQAVASANSANANFNYQRDLGDYTRARDEFYTNQDRQYGILDHEASRGLQAANQYGNNMMNGYGSMGDYAMGGANARAASTMASGNAWGNFAGDMGNSVGGMAMYQGMYGQSPYRQNSQLNAGGGG
jgi:hypothetical protein